ncbi:RNA polymerase sigma-70 factor (ECF subfamily) [Knoellia remsis]|uniref:RNA polymerase sigma-70 factor (ECF subfamily) n=1 Tax=Knoellia remsis TaxID=407159 RepID=A0A2T0UJU8_9MICO|nr:RNA polymerase sigma factor [Knoellia remsis]PRY58221.1 RNA polymerase sigma-70 factor (ECF subfamily) [Knoellia remsis]
MNPVAAAELRTLVLRAQDGEVEAFERLVDLTQGRLFRTAFMLLGDRQDAEDTVQESLLLAWRRLHMLEKPDAFGGWLTRICVRRATDLGRQRARRATDVTATEDLEKLPYAAGAAPAAYGTAASGTTGATAYGTSPEHTAIVDAQLGALTRVLGSIDPDLRACWVLREIDGLTYDEIARTLAITEPTVRGRLARARSLIIRRMDEWR